MGLEQVDSEVPIPFFGFSIDLEDPRAAGMAVILLMIGSFIGSVAWGAGSTAARAILGFAAARIPYSGEQDAQDSEQSGFPEGF